MSLTQARVTLKCRPGRLFRAAPAFFVRPAGRATRRSPVTAVERAEAACDRTPCVVIVLGARQRLRRAAAPRRCRTGAPPRSGPVAATPLYSPPGQAPPGRSTVVWGCLGGLEELYPQFPVFCNVLRLAALRQGTPPGEGRCDTRATGPLAELGNRAERHLRPFMGQIGCPSTDPPRGAGVFGVLFLTARGSAYI